MAASISGKCRQKGEKNYSGLFDDLLMAYTSRSALERVRTVSMGTLCELTYRVVLRRADLAPEACLMVGNDVGEDMIAETLGMKVFLLTDCLINKAGADIDRYPHGSFDALRDHLLHCQSV